MIASFGWLSHSQIPNICKIAVLKCLQNLIGSIIHQMQCQCCVVLVFLVFVVAVVVAVLSLLFLLLILLLLCCGSSRTTTINRCSE